MAIHIRTTASATLHFGNPLVVQGDSPDRRFAAVFEDDGDTGYFYAMDAAKGGNPIWDALHIYNAAGVADDHKPSSVKIGWSQDNECAVLLINDHPHAVFNFREKWGCCRSGFPPYASGAGWSGEGHEWDDSAIELFA